MNSLLNQYYWQLRTRLASVALDEEDGAEAIEWIAVVAVILILLLAIEPIFSQGGTTIGQQIIAAVTDWIGKFT